MKLKRLRVIPRITKPVFTVRRRGRDLLIANGLAHQSRLHEMAGIRIRKM